MSVAELTVGRPRTWRAVRELRHISVLLADDHALFGEALQLRLSREPDLHPVSVAYNADQVRTQVARDRPGVVVLDMTVGDESGLALAGYVRKTSPDSSVVMLTGAESVSSVVAALQCGVRAWLPKTIKPEQLVRTIRGVTRGEAWLSPDLLGRVLPLLLEREAETPNPLAALTPRERDVLQCMVDGLNRVQIAHRLRLSTNTVRTHIQHLLPKLGVHSTLESVAVALRHGLRARAGAAVGGDCEQHELASAGAAVGGDREQYEPIVSAERHRHPVWRQTERRHGSVTPPALMQMT